METFIGSSSTDLTDVDLFILASNILREANPSPELRGAVIEALAGLEIALERLSADSVTLSLVDGDQELAMTLTTNGNLLAETITLLEPDSMLGIPAGTVLDQRHIPAPQCGQYPPLGLLNVSARIPDMAKVWESEGDR